MSPPNPGIWVSLPYTVRLCMELRDLWPPRVLRHRYGTTQNIANVTLSSQIVTGLP